MGDVVTSGRSEHDRLLRWYPTSWRDRYGEELRALMDDEWGEGTASPRSRRAIVRAGLRERAHATGLVGRGSDPVTRLRSGSLLVLCAWTLFVIGGAGFQKTSEHFARAVPLASRASSQDAFSVVVLCAVISLAAVSIGVVATLPTVLAFLRSGRWRDVRRPVLRSAFASAVVLVTVIPLSLWAHTLNEFQRNGGDSAYSWAITAWALIVIVAAASWTATAIAIARRLSLPARVLRLEGVHGHGRHRLDGGCHRRDCRVVGHSFETRVLVPERGLRRYDVNVDKSDHDRDRVHHVNRRSLRDWWRCANRRGLASVPRDASPLGGRRTRRQLTSVSRRQFTKPSGWTATID